MIKWAFSRLFDIPMPFEWMDTLMTRIAERLPESWFDQCDIP